MAAHRDADVFRFAVAQRVAKDALAGKHEAIADRVVGNKRIVSVSARAGAAAVREMLMPKKRSEVGHG